MLTSTFSKIKDARFQKKKEQRRWSPRFKGEEKGETDKPDTSLIQSFISSFSPAASVDPLLVSVLSSVTEIDSKTEKLRIMGYRPWLETRCVKQEILKNKSHGSLGLVLCLWLLRDSRDESCSWISVHINSVIARSSEAKRLYPLLSDHRWNLEVATCDASSSRRTTECVGPGGSPDADELNTSRLLLKAETRGSTGSNVSSLSLSPSKINWLFRTL